jgi:hypothetical protein
VTPVPADPMPNTIGVPPVAPHSAVPARARSPFRLFRKRVLQSRAQRDAARCTPAANPSTASKIPPKNGFVFQNEPKLFSFIFPALTPVVQALNPCFSSQKNWVRLEETHIGPLCSVFGMPSRTDLAPSCLTEGSATAEASTRPALGLRLVLHSLGDGGSVLAKQASSFTATLYSPENIRSNKIIKLR